MIQIEMTQEDAEVLRDATLIVSGGNSFSAKCKSMKTRKMKRLWEVTDGLRDIVRRVDRAIEATTET